MAQVAIIGAGHLGVVYAAGLADLGHRVRVVDIDARRVRDLRRGRLWFHEPGLPELLRRVRRRVDFTTDPAEALAQAAFILVCVPTPSGPTGDLDDSMLRAAFDAIRRHVTVDAIVINKSTVPVGTAEGLFTGTGLRVVSSPEFLAEGRAVTDFFHPERIVLGTRDADAGRRVAELFGKLKAPVVHTDGTSAELAKLAANTFLAMKVSFANSLARLAESLGADTDDVTRVLALDPRIGGGHLKAGIGFGGSCLPKDVGAIEHLARDRGVSADLFGAILRVNRDQREHVIARLAEGLGSLVGKRVAVLGLAFKAGTDDTRESAGVYIAERLLTLNALVTVYDPIARIAIVYGATKASATRSALAAARGADAVVIATDWPEFSRLAPPSLAKAMRGDLVIDGPGALDPVAARAAGFRYYGFGRGGRVTAAPAGAGPAPRRSARRRRS